MGTKWYILPFYHHALKVSPRVHVFFASTSLVDFQVEGGVVAVAHDEPWVPEPTVFEHEPLQGGALSRAKVLGKCHHAGQRQVLAVQAAQVRRHLQRGRLAEGGPGTCS